MTLVINQVKSLSLRSLKYFCKGQSRATNINYSFNNLMLLLSLKIKEPEPINYLFNRTIWRPEEFGFRLNYV
jgi:hypothetical protein